jgi:GNAT superfamily N-acetyltransferase
VQALISSFENTEPELEVVGYVPLGVILGHDPERDRWVAEHDGQVVGYAWIGGERPERTDAWVVIAPEYRRHGLGTRLLGHILERSTQRGASGLMAYMIEQEPQFSFARKHGFQVVGHFRALRMTQRSNSGHISLPEGWTVRSFDQVRNETQLADAYHHGYQDLWGHGVSSLKTVRQWLPHADARDILLAFDANNQVAGCVRVFRTAVSIDAPGLVPAHRSSRMYTALVQAALDALGETTQPVMLESWGDAQATIDAYKTLAFEEIERTAIVSKSL